MIYTNLLFFLAAIFLFSMAPTPHQPSSGWMSLFFCLLLFLLYGRLADRLFRKRSALQSAGYFSTEKRLSFLAVVFFGLLLFAGNAKYYLSWLSLGGRVPSLVNIAGLGLFLLFYLIMWRAARKSYESVFGQQYTTRQFLYSNLKANLPIVLPWIALSILADLIELLPWQGLRDLFNSNWGDLVFFGVFLLFVVVFFPPMVKRLWGCIPLKDSGLRARLVEFCRKQNFDAEIYLWPLFEGRVLTAGVMGIVPGLRYLLITPALIESMSLEELEAVMAHEIGHVKKMHILLYVALIGGFSIVAGFFAGPALSFFLSRDFIYSVLMRTDISPNTLLTVFGGGVMFVGMIVYFRYIFGYFMRNFERQADLNVFPTLGNSTALISAFEKIAILSGDVRDQPSWHHFGIGERVDYLEKCEENPSMIGRHNRKVRLSLLGYVLVCALGIMAANHLPVAQYSQKFQEMANVVTQLKTVKGVPDKALLLRMYGDVMVNRKLDSQAIAAYGRSLALEPSNPETLNNLAWLLLTSKKSGLRDPLRALTLARSAALLNQKGYVLDTLAVAYWANGFVDEAVAAEKRAVHIDPGRSSYYLSQIQKFSKETYKEAMKKPQVDEENGTS